MPKKGTELPTDPYTTFNTMQSLGFDRNDVLNQLLALEISEYMETFIDDKDNSLPLFLLLVKLLKARMCT